MAPEMDEEEVTTQQGSQVSNKDLWQGLAVMLAEREALTEWIKVPSHVGTPEGADRGSAGGTGSQKARGSDARMTGTGPEEGGGMAEGQGGTRIKRTCCEQVGRAVAVPMGSAS